ncbi:RRM domain-containing protein [Entamoeba marina]
MQVSDTLVFSQFSDWTKIQDVIRFFENNTGIHITAIEMISPSQGFVRYSSPMDCESAFKRLRDARVQCQIEFAPPTNIIDIKLAQRIASSGFMCHKESLDLSCVPYEYLISQEQN